MTPLAKGRIVLWQGGSLWALRVTEPPGAPKSTDFHAHHAIQVTLALDGRYELHLPDRSIGGPALVERMGWVRPGGRAVAIGYVLGESLTVDLPNWLLQDVALLPVNMIRRTDEARSLAERFAPLLVAGELTLGVQCFDFDDAPQAMAMLASGGLAGRAVLIPEEN